MPREYSAVDKPVPLSDEILRGLPSISSFMGVNSKTTTGFIKAGLPVTRLGLRLAMNRRLCIEWIEKRANTKSL
jgi:hypothetical protein